MGTTHDLPGTDVVEHLLAPGVLQITLKRPQVKNALRASTWLELVDSLEGAATNREVRVVVMSAKVAPSHRVPTSPMTPPAAAVRSPASGWPTPPRARRPLIGTSAPPGWLVRQAGLDRRRPERYDT
jgi:hypothetical protein